MRAYVFEKQVDGIGNRPAVALAVEIADETKRGGYRTEFLIKILTVTAEGVQGLPFMLELEPEELIIGEREQRSS
jgi:hypothetical protein